MITKNSLVKSQISGGSTTATYGKFIVDDDDVSISSSNSSNSDNDKDKFIIDGIYHKWTTNTFDLDTSMLVHSIDPVTKV